MRPERASEQEYKTAGHSVVGVAAAYLAIYLIWGSTYLAIRFAIETLPPLLMAAIRNCTAGLLLYTWARSQGAARPSLVHWRSATIIGGLLLLGGNGAVVWAEQRVPSGLTALLVAIVPLWMVLFEWLRPGGRRPSWRVAGGLAMGLAGMVLLAGPESIAGGGHVDHVGAGVLVFGTLSWAMGSIYSRHADLPRSPLLVPAMEALAGGALLALGGLVRGEWALFDLAAISLRSMLAVGYLIVFGSLVGFTAYIWLLRVSTPARVSTYAYVNPVVAMFLGWALAGERLTPANLLAAAVILAAVVLITAAPHPAPRRAVDSSA